MSVLKDVLSESEKYYLDIKKKIEKKLRGLPKGSVKERNISGRKYYYLQQRIGSRVPHKYLGKDKPEVILKQIQERKALRAQLKKVNEALKMLRRAHGRKHA